MAKPKLDSNIKDNRIKLLNLAIDTFERSSFRFTEPRRALLEVILGHDGAFSAPSLIESTKKNRQFQFDPVTIYRNLTVFEELKIIERCDFSGETSFYELVLGRSGHHHHHIICNQCQKVDHLDFCIVEAQASVLEKLGYTNLSHKLEFAGLCPQCSRS